MKKYIILAICMAFSSQIMAAKKISPDKFKGMRMKEMVPLMTEMKGTVPAQWRVIWKGDTATEATISWSTAEKGKKHIVHYGKKSTKGKIKKYKFHTSAEVNGTFTVMKSTGKEKSKKDKKKKKKAQPAEPAAAFFHHVSLKKLTPNTRYYFTIESDSEKSREFYFITAPKKSKNFKILHGGDSRSGLENRGRMNLLMSYLVQKDKEILALAHGGDYVAGGASWGQWRLWLSQNELLTGPDGRVLPIIPTRGNHDKGKNADDLFNQIFNFNVGGRTWYPTQLTKDVALITLDTNTSGGGDQLKFLEGQLKKLRPKVKWLLTQYHRPLVPAVKGPPGHAKLWMPLFEKYNVDLACESDGHCIKRTVPIRNGKKDPTGVTYIGEGGLGVGQYKPKTDRWYLQDGGVVSRGHHVMVLSFTPQELNIKTILLDTKVFDDHTLKVRK